MSTKAYLLNVLQTTKELIFIFIGYNDEKITKYMKYNYTYYIEHPDGEKTGFVNADIPDQAEKKFMKKNTHLPKNINENSAKSFNYFDKFSDILLDLNIKLYCIYEIKTKEKYITMDDLTIDSDENMLLNIITIYIETETSERGLGSVPLWSQIHTDYFNRELWEINFFKTQKIKKIILHQSENDKITSLENTNEEILIKEFIKFLKNNSFEVIFTYNYVKFNYLYHRCVYLDGISHHNLQDSYLSVLNNVDFNELNNFGKQKILEYTFPLLSVEGIKTKTRMHLNYMDNANLFKKEGSPCSLIRRIVIDFFSLDRSEKLDPNDVRGLYTEIRNNHYLDLILTMTGRDLCLPYYYFKKNMYLCFNLIRTTNPNLFFPSFSPSNKPIKIEGAKCLDITKRIYINEDGLNIFMVDFTSFYPTILTTLNSCLTTLSTDPNDPSFYVNEEIDELKFTTKRKGALQNTITQLLEKRNELKDKIKMLETKSLKDDRYTEDISSLKLEEKIVKLKTNIIYGQLGLQINSNYITAPKIANLVTKTGRDMLEQLSNYLSNTCNVIFGDTDSLVVSTLIDEDELLELLKKFKEKYHYNVDIKGKYRAFLPQGKKKWVGIGMNDEFINTGVISKKDLPLMKDIKYELLNFVLRNSLDTDTSEMFTCIEKILEKYKTKDDIISKTRPHELSLGKYKEKCLDREIERTIEVIKTIYKNWRIDEEKEKIDGFCLKIEIIFAKWYTPDL